MQGTKVYPNSRQEYVDHLKVLDKKLRPGFNKIFCSSKSVLVENYLKILLADIRDLHRDVRAFHRTFGAIRGECKTISGTHLIHSRGDHNFKQMPFEKLQEKNRLTGHRIISECYERIISETKVLSKQFETKSTYIQQEWINHLRKIDNMILLSLLNCTRSSLNELNVQLGDRHSCDNDCLMFSTSVELQNGEIICQPSLISVTNSVNEVVKQTVNVMKEFHPVTPNQEENSVISKTFYEIICNDDMVLNKTVNIMNHITNCARKVQEELFIFQKYNRLWKMDKVSFLRRYSKTSKQNLESDVQKFKSMHDAIQKEKTFETVSLIKLDFSSLKTELCKLAYYFQDGLMSLVDDNEIVDVCV